MHLDISSPRPLAEVALLLEERFGQVVTYEDAPYRHPDDMIRDEGERVIPRGGRLFIQYRVSDSLRTVLDKALKKYIRSGYPGTFTVEQLEGDYHIVPESFRNTDGVVEQRQSLLDIMISLPQKMRTGLQLVEDIMLAISEVTGETIDLGILPTNALVQHVSMSNVSNGRARDLLTGLFREMRRPLSWQLLNDPGKAVFFINIHLLAEQVRT